MHAARSGDPKHLVHKTNLSAPFRHQTMISQIFPTLKTAALLDRGFLSFYPPEETAPFFLWPCSLFACGGIWFASRSIASLICGSVLADKATSIAIKAVWVNCISSSLDTISKSSVAFGPLSTDCSSAIAISRFCVLDPSPHSLNA